MTISAKAKRETVLNVFGSLPPDDAADCRYIGFLFTHRDCATVPSPDGPWRDLVFVDEYDELDYAITAALNRIRDRDGVRVMREVAKRLVEAIDDKAMQS
jgi:hypothetical protein